jgi:hypothetical protein
MLGVDRLFVRDSNMFAHGDNARRIATFGVVERRGPTATKEAAAMAE